MLNLHASSRLAENRGRFPLARLSAAIRNRCRKQMFYSPNPFRFRGGVLAAIALAVFSGGCTDAPLASPATVPGPPSTAMSPPLLVREATALLPADNHPDLGMAYRWFSVFTTPSEAGFYLIKVDGKIRHTWNTLCTGCANTLDGKEMGPLEGGAGTLDLGYAAPGLVMENGREPSRFYPQQHPDGPRTSVVLTEFGGSQTIWARRPMGTGCLLDVWGSCDSANRQPQYFLSQSQTVTAHRVPTPVAVDAPAAVAPGQAATFTAQVVENLPIDRDANGNFRVWWTWRSGDTLATPGGGVEDQRWNCQTRLSCSHVPDKSGRMQITAYVHERYLVGYSDVIRVREPRLVLTCPSSVQRGQTGSCTVAADPSGTPTIVRWEFKPDSVMIHPKIGLVEMAAPVTDTASALEWGGEFVLPGTVKVYGLFGSRSDSATARVQITPRSWETGRGPAPPRVDLGFGAPPYTGQIVRWGENLHVRSDGTLEPGVMLLGFDLGSSTPVPPDRIRTVGSGPNHGYQYVEQYEIRLNRGYRLNKYITPESVAPDIEVSPGLLESRWHALSTLGWGDPNVFLQRVIQHETSGAAGRIGHQDGLVDAISGEVCGNVARRIERIAGSADRVNNQLRNASFAGHEFHTIGSGHYRVHGHVQGASVVVRDVGNPAPLQYQLYDRQQPLPDVAYRHFCEYEGWGV